MTRRLYYGDSYLREFTATVVESVPDRNAVYLDSTAFYPTSGGQPFDTGCLGPARVVDVVDEGDRIRHLLDQPLNPGSYAGRIDWERRFDHMQQHTGQHLLSAVFHDLIGCATVSVHFGSDTSTLDVDVAALAQEQLLAVERRANEVVFENRAVSAGERDSSEELGLRKATDRQGTVRVVTIAGLDRSACGGTHVRSTGEIGPIRLLGLEKIRGIQRVEFTCGWRTLRSWRSDLTQAGTALESQTAKLADADKQRRKLVIEVAGFRGRDLYEATAANARGIRLHVNRVSKMPDDEMRAEALAFTAGPGAAYVVARREPPSLFVAVSGDSPMQAGAVLKPILEAKGGRGGGSARSAQGSLSPDDVEIALAELVRCFEV